MAQYVGERLRRKEDERLITGRGQYVADIQFANMLEITFVRSTFAHAKIKRIDISKALEVPGVFAIITAKDIEGEIEKIPLRTEISLADNLIATINPVLKPCPEVILAKDKVIYVGQAIAAVIAENRYIAEDAADLVEVEYEPLPVVMDAAEAVKEDAEVIHPELNDNIQASYEVKVGNVEEAFAQADHTMKATFYIPRMSGNPIETRGVVATYDRSKDDLQVWSATQSVYMLRTYISKSLNMAEDNIRVIAPDIGGGFGPKGAIYPEEILIPYLAKRFNRPMKWIEDRIEHMKSTLHSRDQYHEAEIAFNRDGTIVALRSNFLQDVGAYNPTGLTPAYNTAAHMRGMFKIPYFEISGKCVITNKTPSISYRGAGRQEAVFVMDRFIQKVAKFLNKDPVEIIQKNLIQADEMPYDMGMFYRDGANLVYDSGDYPAAFQQALELVEYEKFREEQKQARANGKYIGIGFSSYIEGTGIGPHEGAVVKLDNSGQIVVYVSSTPHGQSHETTMAQICADELNLHPEQIKVRAGDTSLLQYGVGTFASRGAVTAGSAVYVASRKVREKMLAIAEEMLEVSKDDLVMEEGKVYVKNKPDLAVTFQDIALAAKPGPRCKVPEGMEPGVEFTHYFVPKTVTFSSGVHVAVVEVDKQTGFTKILKYVVVHDCGKVINPHVVDGQIQGGVAQGIGETLYEEIVYDDNGQLITGTYMDYLLPTAMEVPDVVMGHQECLTPLNPLGIKGVGEGGAISPLAAIANGIIDALSPLDIDIDELPISPSRLFQLIQDAESNDA